IAVDGWSVGWLARDLGLAYRARCDGGLPTFTPLPVQYSDYAVWQRELLGTAEDPDSLINGQLAFWREALSGAPEELVLPFDRPGPLAGSFRGGRVAMTVNAQTHARLAEVAGRAGVTMFMVVQAGVVALLSRSGAGFDIPVGTAMAGRLDPALERLV